jgi:hypothetical protein
VPWEWSRPGKSRTGTRKKRNIGVSGGVIPKASKR